MTLPNFQLDGLLSPGMHDSTWHEIAARFGMSPYRQAILAGLEEATNLLARASCSRVYVDGSFVTREALPGDFDACWDPAGVDVSLLDPVFLDFTDRRAAEKARFRGELFLSTAAADAKGTTFLKFVQIDKATGKAKGIVALDLGGSTQ